MRPYAIILFDGDCGLCNRLARFVASHDPTGRFRFASLQGEPGRRECRRLGVTVPMGDPDTIVVTTEHHAWVRSDAAVEIARRLPWPWRAAFVLRAVPTPVRDAVYRWVARNRFRWFGRAGGCASPTAELRARSLD